MLSTSKRFLFIHVPKTGGNSIQDALRQYADDAIVSMAPHQDGVERFELRSALYATHKHSTLLEYRQAYGDALFASLFKFACVRNPWDRAVSFYFSPHRGVTAWNPESFKKFVKTVPPVSHYMTEADECLALAINNVDFIVRFESIADNFCEACRRIGIPYAGLPVRNKSTHGSYRDYYNTETRRLVADLFAEEISAFGYSY